MNKDKDSIRKYVKGIFSNKSNNELLIKSDNIQKSVIKYINSKNIKSVFTYVWMHNEVFTESIIEELLSKKLQVFLPKILNNYIYPIEIKDFKDTMLWKFWILEPKSNDIFLWNIDLVIIPWRAFTLNWKRIWNWFWYYDKFLWRKENKNIYKLWICYDFQIFDDFETESHDISLDKIIYR